MVRDENGQTIEEIVALCNLLPDGPRFTVASWSKWENGVTPRDMATVVEYIHRATGVNRGWLMWGGTSARLSHAHLTGLPSMLDRRYKSPNDRPILTLVPPTED